jgi:hypothetical protein
MSSSQPTSPDSVREKVMQAEVDARKALEPKTTPLAESQQPATPAKTTTVAQTESPVSASTAGSSPAPSSGSSVFDGVDYFNHKPVQRQDTDLTTPSTTPSPAESVTVQKKDVSVSPALDDKAAAAAKAGGQ